MGSAVVAAGGLAASAVLAGRVRDALAALAEIRLAQPGAAADYVAIISWWWAGDLTAIRAVTRDIAGWSIGCGAAAGGRRPRRTADRGDRGQRYEQCGRCSTTARPQHHRLVMLGGTPGGWSAGFGPGPFDVVARPPVRRRTRSSGWAGLAAEGVALTPLGIRLM